MDKLYPIIKHAKTTLGRKLEDGEWGMLLAYCPTCNKRLDMDKADPIHSRLGKLNKKVGKFQPFYCEKCGSLIYPLS